MAQVGRYRYRAMEARAQTGTASWCLWEHADVEMPIKNTFVHQSSKQLGAARREQSCPARLQAQEVHAATPVQNANSSTGNEDADTAVVTERNRNGRLRPCKDKRMRMQKQIDRLEAEINSDPFAFDMEAVNLDNIFDDKMRKQTLKKLKALHRAAIQRFSTSVTGDSD